MRDAIELFREADTVPFGVNHGDAESHQAFIDAYEFPFDLLVDEGLAVSQAYDAAKADGSGITRTVVVVGKDGRILFKQAGAPPPGNILEAIRVAQDEITPAG